MAQPVRLMPRISVMQAMEFAVKSPAQDPAVGHASHSIWWASFSEMWCVFNDPTVSKLVARSIVLPLWWPAFIGPPVSIIAGRSSLPAAISMPGVILSQFVTPTQPSREWESIMISMLSAMWSLDGRLRRISAYMAMPSQTPGTPQVNGTPPASLIPLITSFVSSFRWMWPGIMFVYALATPMNGFLKSESLSPVARRRERWGRVSGRVFRIWDFIFLVISFFSN